MKAVRKLEKFNFEGEGAAVALVSKTQGGPANGRTTLITKATSDVDRPLTEDEIVKALGRDVTVSMTIIEFLTRYLSLYWGDAEIVASLMGYSVEDISEGSQSSIVSWAEYLQEELEPITFSKSSAVNKAKENLGVFVDKYLNKSNDNPEELEIMTDKTLTPEQIEEMVQKATEDVRKSLEAEYKAKDEARQVELDVLKSAEAARQSAHFSAEAATYKSLVGDVVETEALAKALQALSTVEDAAPVVEVLKALRTAKGQEDLLVSKGKDTPETDGSYEAKVEALAKSLQKDNPALKDFEAYVQAADQLRT